MNIGVRVIASTQWKITMDSTKEEWLRKHFTETLSEGPQAKHVKFEHVYSGITSAFHDTKFNYKMVANGIKSVFPNSTSRQVGKARKSHIFGIEPQEQPEPHSSPQLQQEIEFNSRLRLQVKALEERVHGLEENLAGQINSLTASNNLAYHGPDTVDHFNHFTMAKLLEEFEQLSPDVLRLLRVLGGTGSVDGNDDDKEANPTSDTRVMVAMCALVKSRTRKVLGLQLLISFMLVARSTSRQVLYVATYIKIVIYYNTCIGSYLFESCWDMCVLHNNVEIPQTTHSSSPIH